MRGSRSSSNEIGASASEQFPQDLCGDSVDPRWCALAGTGDVEHPYVVPDQPFAHRRQVDITGEVHDKVIPNDSD